MKLQTNKHDHVKGGPIAEMGDLLRRLYGAATVSQRADFDGREIVVTPFNGACGQAGWVIAVNGTPPRGVIISLETPGCRMTPASMFYVTADSSRRLRDLQSYTVGVFLDWYAETHGLMAGVIGHSREMERGE